MDTRDQILSILRENMPALNASYGVSRIGLFGSFARDEATPESDIDLLVTFDRPIGLRFIELVDHLEMLLGRKVDVLTPAGLDSIHIARVSQTIASSLVYA